MIFKFTYSPFFLFFFFFCGFFHGFLVFFFFFFERTPLDSFFTKKKLLRVDVDFSKVMVLVPRVRHTFFLKLKEF